MSTTPQPKFKFGDKVKHQICGVFTIGLIQKGIIDKYDYSAGGNILLSEDDLELFVEKRKVTLTNWTIEYTDRKIHPKKQVYETGFMLLLPPHIEMNHLNPLRHYKILKTETKEVEY